MADPFPAVAAAPPLFPASPPLLPTPQTCNRLYRPPPLLATPSSSFRFAPLPASTALSAAKPGRASISGSWIRDKAAHTAKIPSHASLSSSRAVPTPLTGSWDSGRGSLSSDPSSDKNGKEQRYAPSDAPNAGPAFLNSPPPSDLPIPSFLARGRAS